MARDSMRILRTVRRRSVEQARHALSECLTAEERAADAVRVIADAALRDRAAHQTVEESHQFLEMFMCRLRVGEAMRVSAEAALTAAQARSADALAVVVAARVAVEAVETLIAEQVTADEVDAKRREQHTLDEMARTRFNSANPQAPRRAR